MVQVKGKTWLLQLLFHQKSFLFHRSQALQNKELVDQRVGLRKKNVLVAQIVKWKFVLKISLSKLNEHL